MIQPEIVTSLPDKPPEWVEAIVPMGQPYPLVLTEAQRQAVGILRDNLEIGLHILYKRKYQRGHRIPAKRTAIKAYEPLGEYLYRLYELAVQTHAVVGYSTAYGSASKWFAAILSEAQKVGISRICAEEFPSKQELLKGKRQIVQQIRDGQFDSEDEPHLMALLNAAYRISLTRDPSRPNTPSNFEVEYWKPFVRAYTAVNTAIDKKPGWVAGQINDGNLQYPLGRGKGKGSVKKLNSGS
jgi:hypothetical protein